MDFRIIKLLFDPRGSINKKWFLIGLIIQLLLLVLFYYNLALNVTLLTLFARNNGAEATALYQSIKLFGIPPLPIEFIFFYSSIVLAVKRYKNIHNNKPLLGIVGGIFVFIFFDLLTRSTSTNYFILFDASINIPENVKSFHILLMNIGSLLGLCALIYLSTKKGENNGFEIYDSSYKSFSIESYVINLGKILLLFVSLSALCGLAYFLTENTTVALTTAIVAYTLTLLTFTTLAYKRLEYLQRPFWPFLLISILFLISPILVGIIHFNSSSLNLVNSALAINSVISFLFIFANALLLVFSKPDHA